MISIMLWIFVGMYVLGAIATISRIGKPRPATSPGEAAFVVTFGLTLAALGALAALGVI